jgi:hypothetical protein
VNWVGIDGGTEYTLEYNTVEVGIPDYAWSPTINYYPAVRFLIGNPPSTIIKVTVDLTKEQVILVEGYPVRTRPTIVP